MAKRNKETVTPSEVPDTGLLNPKVDAKPQFDGVVPPPVVAPPWTPAVVIDEVDFNELLELEKAVRQTEDQFNKLAGGIKRMEKDLEVYFAHEKNLNGQMDAKRKDLIKRYKIDEQRQWRIDINNRKIVYQD